MITIFIIAITTIISVMAFRNGILVDKLIFYPPAVKQGEWHRLFTYGVLHVDYTHLFFNMFTFYLFGTDIERVCKAELGGQAGSICFVALYVTALLASIIPTYFKHKNNVGYRGLGASGAVSAVVFAYVLINPMNFMGIMFIPVWLPAFLFGIIFILISIYLDKRQAGGINHSAHITGGIYGIVFMIAAFMILRGINLADNFIAQIRIDSINDLIHFGF